ncbi:MAG TPA: prepilin-type N-terminal cleavage/methylation domain-containing protein [Tepidisphaeraceae bacterium]|nr:prepilin-type N-terminal cleavage/methylation domain-containing protein [Tepidisphaeraceae bacterium]
MRVAVRRAGFTLTELLVVITLIVLLIVLALPAFNFITGSRSVDAAQNVVGAMLGRARSEAINQQRSMGVAFWFDRTNERTAMAIVMGGDATSGEDEYNAWTTTAAAGTPVTYRFGDIVYYAGWDTGNAGGGLGNSPDEAAVGNAPDPATGAARAVDRKFVTKRYRCIVEAGIPSSLTTNRPPDPDSVSGVNSFWGELPPTTLEVFDADVEYLQPGVGLQLVNDVQGEPNNNDQFLRTGVIMFDAYGQLSTNAYSIETATPLALLMDASGIVTPVGTLPDLRTHTAMMLYEREPFLNAPGTEEDVRFEIGTYGTATFATERDDEENWIANNGLLLLVNRYNGTLVRSE